MNIDNEIEKILDEKKPESNKIEYKAVLPPARNVARLISSFANADGGFIILGVSDDMEINGLSQDFHANNITHKALDLLTPTPKIEYKYINYNNKNIYVIQVEKSTNTIFLESKIYKRIGEFSKLTNAKVTIFKENGYVKIQEINKKLNIYKKNATNSKVRLIEHYQSILKIIDNLKLILYPTNTNTPTENQEGRILSRILYSSFVDNFETYLSELLYEIFLANPSTLKSNQLVSVEEVLNCSDLQDFIKYWANRKISKLQKGSVKGFIKDNKQIRDLDVIDEKTQKEIESLLQIRHLYSHRNGIVDEKFLKFNNGEYQINEEHLMSISEICNKLDYFSEIINSVDEKAISKYKLATF